MPPASRNQRDPTACDTPTPIAASQLDCPAAINAQKRRRSSRRATPGPARRRRLRPQSPIRTPPTSHRNHPPPWCCDDQLNPPNTSRIRYTERLAEAGIEPSVGSVGDSYDNALAETVIGLFKTEVIRRRGPWRTLEAVEFATLEWVDWFNNRRLLEPIGNIPPAEAEARYYRPAEAPALAA